MLLRGYLREDMKPEVVFTNEKVAGDLDRHHLCGMLIWKPTYSRLKQEWRGKFFQNVLTVRKKTVGMVRMRSQQGEPC
jgi:hypothetical protein